MGDPELMETAIGPVISKKHLEFIESCVEEGLQDPSLELLCGGKRHTGFVGDEEHLNEGNYFEPTVIAASKDTLMNTEAVAELHKRNILFQTELFGPIVLLIPFQTRQQAIDLANDSQFGLG